MNNASDLGISHRSNPLQNAYAKLGLGGRAEFATALRTDTGRTGPFTNAHPNRHHGRRDLLALSIVSVAIVSAALPKEATDLLIAKGVVAGELPLSPRPSKERRYRITDSYLRFWFAFLGPHLTEIDRMRSDLTINHIRAGWTSWRGRAIEPLARESLARLLPAHGIPAASAVGGYWTRTNRPVVITYRDRSHRF